MCRMPALAATILTFAATPVLAAASATPTAAPTSTAPAGPILRTKAGPLQRAEATRIDPLARAAFWARELEIDPRDVEAGLGLAVSLRQLGRFPEAYDAAGQVLVIQPDNIDALLESARAQIGRGQGFYAIEPARRAQALAPRDWRPVGLLAVAYEQADRNEEALAAHRLALTLAPNEPAVLANLAMYHAGHGDLVQAEQLLRRAAALPRADARVRQNLALVIGLQGRLAEAEQLVRQDLPPEQAANNIAWLKAATARTPTGEGRSWSAVTRGGS
jgi:Flp pilus assembly protein TadD